MSPGNHNWFSATLLWVMSPRFFPESESRALIFFGPRIGSQRQRGNFSQPPFAQIMFGRASFFPFDRAVMVGVKGGHERLRLRLLLFHHHLILLLIHPGHPGHLRVASV